MVSCVSHKIPIWLLQGMKLYYTDARIQLKSNVNYVVQRAFRDTKNLVTTQQFFVNSFGNGVFRVAPLIDQFRRQVDQPI